MKGLLLAIWPVPLTVDRSCDNCSRPSSWFCTTRAGDEHLCVRHAVNLLHEIEREVEGG